MKTKLLLTASLVSISLSSAFPNYSLAAAREQATPTLALEACTWSVPTRISTGAYLLMSDPVLASNENGQAMVVWRTVNNTFNFSTRSSYSSSWTTPTAIQLGTLSPYGGNSTKLVMDNAGNATIIFMTSLGIQGSYTYAMRWNGTTWSAPQQIANGFMGSSNIEYSDIVIVPTTGDIYLVSTKSEANNQRIFLVHYNNSTHVWDNPIAISPPVAYGPTGPTDDWPIHSYSLNTNATGDLILGYTVKRASAQEERRVEVMNYVNGTWSAPVAFPEQTRNVRTAIDNQGNGYVAYDAYQMVNGSLINAGVYAAKYENHAWSSPVFISNTNLALSEETHPNNIPGATQEVVGTRKKSLVIDQNGNGVLAFVKAPTLDSPDKSVYISKYNPSNGSWATVSAESNNTIYERTIFPALSYQANGRVIMGWNWVHDYPNPVSSAPHSTQFATPVTRRTLLASTDLPSGTNLSGYNSYYREFTSDGTNSTLALLLSTNYTTTDLYVTNCH